MGADGKGRRKLVEEDEDPDDPTAEGGGAENPAFAPTGNRIVYMSGGDLWIVGLNGSNPDQVTADGGDNPDWGRA